MNHIANLKLKRDFRMEQYLGRVKSVSPLGPTVVYDVTVPSISAFDANGFYAHNCSEQSLEDKETCCLAEIFLPNIASIEELKDVATTLYRICKHSLRLPCHHPDTEEVVHRNMRIGLGMSGYLQAREDQRGWLSETYEYLREYDRTYSKKHNWPTSVKISTIKPSGSLSLLPGITPGCHPGTYRYFIRRIRMASNSPLLKVCRDHGYHMEYQRQFDGSLDTNTMVVEFPCSYPEGALVAEQVTAIEQLEWIKRLQHDWSDNSVSCTVYYKLEELEGIKAWLKQNYNNSIKTVSFFLHRPLSFPQLPYEEISKERYLELKAKTRRITSISNHQEEELDDLNNFECPGGSCPIK